MGTKKLKIVEKDNLEDYDFNEAIPVMGQKVSSTLEILKLRWIYRSAWSYKRIDIKLHELNNDDIKIAIT